MGNILRLNMHILASEGEIDATRGLLVADEIVTKRAIDKKALGKSVKSHGYTSHLFQQAQNALYKIDDFKTELSAIFYILDFSKCSDEHYKRLLYAYNGIEIAYDGKKRIIVDYLKSNSMSRESKIY